MKNKEREEAIKHLKEMQRKYVEKSPYEWSALKKAIRELETNRWIPVNEKLPRLRNDFFSEDVLVTVKDEFGTGIDIGFYDYEDKEWDTHTIDNAKVLAWKPLPKPYKDNL